MPKEKNNIRVLLTRENNNALSEALSARGGVDVLEIPLIKVEPSADANDMSDVLEEISRYDWITFSSPNGVKHFFNEFLKSLPDIRMLGLARIACVGESTASELKKFFLRADVIPEESNSVSMIKKMDDYERLENLKVLYVHGSISPKEIIARLEMDYHAIVDAVEVYKTTLLDVEKSSPAAVDFRKNGADVVVFASPSAVESFAKNAINLLLGTKAIRPKIVTIGATTTEALAKYGMKVAAQAKSPSPEDVADAVFEAVK